jgi:hypothetical protein
MSIARQEWTPARQVARDNFKEGISNAFRASRRRSKVTPRQREEVVRRCREGEDSRALALEFGLSATYIRSLSVN